jgi:membrane fusion protein (multidrug efflux system)
MLHRITCTLLAVCSFLTAEGKLVEQHSVSAIGTLYPKHKTILSSIVSGRVEDVCVDVGDYVSEDQILVTLDPTFFSIALTQAQAAVDAAKIERLDAKRNVERMKKLWEKPEGEAPSIPKKRFEDAEIRYSQSLIQLRKAKAELKKALENLNETKIRSPYQGVITKRFVHPGESITSTPVTDLLEIAYIDTLYVEFSIPQSLRSKIHVKDRIDISLEGEEITNTTAYIERVFPNVDEKTRTVRCRAVIDNQEHRLHIGALVKVKVTFDNLLVEGT